ncbi:hypothetical protein ACIGKR_07075 [Rhodococcus qingshengii]|uniref:hypothetical protein n=1 Tax=Rhodococcus qingshengii TaxID=334542 RepID=UPI0037CC22F5
MPTNINEFEEDTAFERYILARGFPLLPQPQGGVVIDLGDILSAAAQSTAINVQVTAADSSRSPGDQFGINEIRPLVFGAAWKVLDLLVEMRLEQDGVREPKRKNPGYSIAFKTKCVRTGKVSAPPPIQADVWKRVMKCFDATETLRHSVVHRRLTVDPSTGDLCATSLPGEFAPKPLTIEEQSAFCRLADGVAEAVIRGKLPNRTANILKWVLDQLAAHHKQPSFGTSRTDGLVPLVVVRPSPGPTNDLELDFKHIRNRARAAVKDVSYYDLEIHLPDNKVLAAPLEDTPDARVKLSVDNLPDWLRLV